MKAARRGDEALLQLRGQGRSLDRVVQSRARGMSAKDMLPSGAGSQTIGHDSDRGTVGGQ